MALVVKDRVKETTATTGTGTLTLAGAVTGFQSFSSALSDGDTTYYAIFESSTGEWEVGLGTFTASGTTLARTTILASSNSGSAVNLTAGAADVFITQPATKAAYFDGSGDLVLNQDPTSALQAATKQYVDTIAAAGLHYHSPVRVQTTANLSATYDNGSSGVGATLTNSGTQAAISIDNVTLSSADRVLVSEQTNAAHNGVYTVTTVGSGSTNWVLTRATDADSYGPSDPDALGEGDAFFIKEGDTNAGHLDVMTTSGTITFGTTNIVFSEVAETTVYSAGNGLTLTGTTFAAGAGTGVTVNANDIAIGQDVGTSADVTFNSVTASLTGNVTGNVSGSSGSTTGNAATATKLATSRTISLTGDVTGSASFDGSANASIAATIAADSVALGTDTTGNYVATGAVSGNGLSGSASAEGATFTVTSNATNANTASTIVFRDASGNFSAGTITAALNGNASSATSATDADTVDSLHASQFLRSDASDTTTGQLTVDNDNGVKVVYGVETTNVFYTGYGMDSQRSATYVRPTNDNTQTLYVGGSGSANDWANIELKVGNNNNVNINGNTVWHAGNDGSGSGLDADTVDGYQASESFSSSTVAVRNSNGYLFSSYFNGWGTFSTSGASSGMVNFTGTNGSDTYGRSYNGTAARAAMGLATTDSPTFSNVSISGVLYHDGDLDTNLTFTDNTITLNTGGSGEITVNTTGVRLGDTGNGYFQPVTGNYGSVQIDGGAHGGYEGYSIGGRAVFMHDNASRMGLYDDVNNEWGFLYDFNSAAQIFYNGSSKLQTTSTGVNVTGTAEVDTLQFSDGSTQTSAGASTGKAIAMAIVFG